MTFATLSGRAPAASARRIHWLRGPIQCLLSATRRRSDSKIATDASVRNATRSSTRRTITRWRQRGQRLCVVGAGTSNCAQYGHDAWAGHLKALAFDFGRFLPAAFAGRGAAAGRTTGGGAATTWATGAMSTASDSSVSGDRLDIECCGLGVVGRFHVNGIDREWLGLGGRLGGGHGFAVRFRRSCLGRRARLGVGLGDRYGVVDGLRQRDGFRGLGLGLYGRLFGDGLDRRFDLDRLGDGLGRNGLGVQCGRRIVGQRVDRRLVDDGVVAIRAAEGGRRELVGREHVDAPVGCPAIGRELIGRDEGDVDVRLDRCDGDRRGLRLPMDAVPVAVRRRCGDLELAQLGGGRLG